MNRFKNNFVIALFLLMTITFDGKTQVCAIPGNDGDSITVNGTINTYWSVAPNTYDSSSASIPLQNRRGSAVNISSGDLVLVIQMQCADINYTDTDAYGDGVAGDLQFNSLIASGYTDPAGTCLAGQYEYLRAGPSSSASSLDLSDNPLQHIYVQADATPTSTRKTMQIIRVPQYNNATLSANVRAANWNGLTGGVAVLDVARTLDFANHRIVVNGRGFRGGGGRARSVNDANIRYRWDVDDRHASKGEGIAGTPRFISNKRALNNSTASITDLGTAWIGYPTGTANTGDFSRGAPGNAGGGGSFWNGSSDNGGGGGGANGGAGGRGGAGWRSAGYAGILADYSNLPEKKWGFGGSAFSSASISRVVLGGGGAAGDNNNNSTPQESSGAAGGGIVMIRARSITGTGRILARGAQASDNSLNDGAGAGGAGGSVIVVTSDMSSSNLIIDTAGGIGGSPWLTGNSAHGTGGGGGGGVIFRTGTATTTITGGANGLTNTNDSPSDGANHGAKPGSVGIDTVITVPSDTPGVNTGFRCLDFGDAPSSYGLADHNLGNTPNLLFLGAVQADGNPETLTAIPSANADTDDLSDIDDEDGISLPTTSAADGTYTVAATVFNNTGGSANLCGWVDFDQDGLFQSDESVCTTVTSMASSQAINLVFTVPIADRNNTGTIIARFRLTSDALSTATPTGSASNGEVEDHMTTVTTLPVSINGFESHQLKDGLLVKWNTASETRNIGFYLWGNKGKSNDTGFERLSDTIIATKSKGALDPQSYEIKLPNKYKNYTNLAISAIDSQGEEELFGMYDVGLKYGRKNQIDNIDWQTINNKLASIPLQKKSNKNLRTLQINALKAQMHTNSYGMHRVTYTELLNAGFDLQGAKIESIAVTLKGHPVARRIGKFSTSGDLIYADTFEDNNSPSVNNSYGTDLRISAGQFGPGMFIDFWAKAPAFPDAEYLRHYTYEISINKTLAQPVQLTSIRDSEVVGNYQKNLTINEDNEYAFTNTSVDPWYAKMLRDYSSEADKSYQVEFLVDNNIVSNRDGMLSVKLIGGANLPLNPDHQVEISFNGTALLTHDFDGVEAIELNIPVASALLHAGNNNVQLKLTSGTQAAFDIVLVDEVQLSYSTTTTLKNDVLNIQDQLISKNLSVTGMSSNDIIAYASSSENSLRLLQYNSNNSSTKVANASSKADYWISTTNQLRSVSSINTIAIDDLLGTSADFLIIAHPSFIPSSTAVDHPLNRYIQHRQSQGWNIRTIGIDDIQAQYGGGMPLPDALTNFLKAADKSFGFSHVLLVGSDSYDYLDRLGLHSISYIPTKYAATLYIPHTPSDQLLVDLDDDMRADKAIGRWPVRTLTDLNAIVDKTLQWDLSSNIDSIFVTDGQNGTDKSFELQSQRLINLFMDYNWNQNNIIKLYTDEMDPSIGASAATQVRQQLFQSWENKKSLTNFIGHGSPTQWSRQGILNANDIDGLFNNTSPTLIGTLTCYTSYFVSPRTNTLAHRLLNGSDGTINGAVAVHGAASLSSYSSNEMFEREVLNQQLMGKTLGQAILEARNQAHTNGYRDQVINWTLLGDPTIKVITN